MDLARQCRNQIVLVVLVLAIDQAHCRGAARKPKIGKELLPFPVSLHTWGMYHFNIFPKRHVFHHIIVPAVSLFIGGSVFVSHAGGAGFTLKSPDGKIKMTVQSGGHLTYAVMFRDRKSVGTRSEE